MDATKGRLGLFSFGVWLPRSLAIMDYVWAQSVGHTLRQGLAQDLRHVASAWGG
jgi:hypothetical protein